MRVAVAVPVFETIVVLIVMLMSMVMSMVTVDVSDLRDRRRRSQHPEMAVRGAVRVTVGLRAVTVQRPVHCNDAI